MEIKLLNNKRHVFWQAFLLTMMFFFLGLVFGVYLEQIKTDNSNIIFYQSESSLYDSFALGKILENPSVSCNDLKSASIEFANQIYEEARELERFDNSNKLTDSLKVVHRKYDLLRTLLWINVIELKQKCGEINTVVYLYKYNTDDIETRSKQLVWSRILKDLKELEGEDIILIPIAVDQDIVSLDYLVKTYNVVDSPAVIINEKDTFYDHQLVEDLEGYLK